MCRPRLLVSLVPLICASLGVLLPAHAVAQESPRYFTRTSESQGSLQASPTRREGYRTIGELGEQALSARSANYRITAAQTLSRIASLASRGDRPQFNPIDPLTDDEGQQLRSLAVKMYASKDSFVRLEAVRILTHLPHAEIRDVAVAALSDRVFDIRPLACKVLEKLGDDAAVESLATAVATSRAFGPAIAALGGIGTDRAKQALENLLTIGVADEHRELIYTALDRIDDRSLDAKARD